MQEHKDNDQQDQATYQDDYEPQKLDFPIVELSKDFFDVIDMRFYSVLVGSFIFHFLLVLFFLMNPITGQMKARSIAKVQERLARELSEQELHETPIAKFEFMDSGKEEESITEEPQSAQLAKSVEPKAESSASRPDTQVPKRPRRGRGGRSQEELASSVGSKGVLALLTSSSSSASGEQVADILGADKEGSRDLDEALSGLSGVRTSASSGESSANGVKGGRAEGDGSLDGLVSGLGKANAGSFERGGDLVMMSDSPRIENRGNKGGAGRSQDDVQTVVLAHNKTIQYCYEKELKRNPSLKGKVVVRFIITPDGSVENVELVSSNIKNRRVEQCIISKIRRWSDFGEVDPSFGNTTIRQAYAFGY